MKNILSLLFLFSISTLASAQNTDDVDLVKKACQDYIEGFYEGDTTKIIRSFKPSLNKLGFWKNKNTGKYKSAGHMSFEQAKGYANDVFVKKEFPKESAPKIIEVLDVMNQIASAKVTAWWGVDYILLSKEEDKWMIEQVLWEGPLQR